MALFIAVETRDLTNILVLSLLFFLLLDLLSVGGASQGLLLVSPFLLSFLFLLLAGMLGRLASLGPGWGRFCFFYLRLLWVRVFGSYSLGLHL